MQKYLRYIFDKITSFFAKMLIHWRTTKVTAQEKHPNFCFFGITGASLAFEVSNTRYFSIVTLMGFSGSAPNVPCRYWM